MADPALLAGAWAASTWCWRTSSAASSARSFPSFRQSLGGLPQGRLIVSGILRTEAPAVMHDAEIAGFRIVRIDEEEEWWSALLCPVG